MSERPPEPFVALVGRYDPAVFELGRRSARLRLEGAGERAWEVVLDGDRAQLRPAGARRPDALLRADARTWSAIAEDPRAGLEAFRTGRLRLRHDLHLGVGFLAATTDGAGDAPGALRFRHVRTRLGSLSIAEAGPAGAPAVLLLHGLGGTKVSFLPTVAALAHAHRAIAVDLPGFGDSVKPVRFGYDAPAFARATVGLLDALGLPRADIVGNSMGGRVALELGLSTPERVGRLALLAPSLAWLRDRPFVPVLRLVPPQLGLVQPAPRPLVEGLVRRLVPAGRDEGWTAAGVDEFLRSYLGARGRAAFYAAARNIYLDEPHGPDGFWTRLPALQPPSLFIWGRRDQLVPIRFAAHVRRALPDAEHTELDCGHVPQLERPRRTHAALLSFLAGDATR